MTEWAPDRGVTASTCPPIAEYGFLSDCESARSWLPTGMWRALPAALRLAGVFGAILDVTAALSPRAAAAKCRPRRTSPARTSSRQLGY